MRKITFIISWVMVVSLPAQDSLLLRPNYSFRDGIYEQFADLKSNEPIAHWDSIKATYFLNPRTESVLIKELFSVEDQFPLDLEKIFAICIDGRTYINTNQNDDSVLTSFSHLKIMGNLNYFTYEKKSKKQVKIEAINPATGLPFRSGYIEKDTIENIQKILNWQNGELITFNLPNFKKLVQNDKPLYKSIIELSEEEAKSKLYKCLLIYNDRHPAYIQNLQKN